VDFILENPDVLLRDEYSPAERLEDWNKLVAKDVTGFDSRSRIGHKLLDHHMPHFWQVANYKGISVVACMTREDLTKACFANLRGHSTPYKSEIRRMLVFSCGLASVTKYRATMAKYIVRTHGAVSVLDPCIGWGGRMIGALAAGAAYTGCDPDPNTFRGLQGILSDIHKDANIHCLPAEDFVRTLPSASFDMVLTSPPYYNLELYTAGEQSTLARTWDEWVREWLRPVIQQCLRCLKPTGKSCWSVKNFKSDGKYPLADIVSAIHHDFGWVPYTTYTLHGPGRPGATKASEEQTFVFTRAESG
jgi:SAM-dependent methyltransferase